MMKITQKPLSWLHPSEINSRKHPEQQINEFARSIKKFDVIRPIVADQDGRILVGHGLYMALKKIGRENADVIIMLGLTEAEKKKLILSDNKIYSLGADDYVGIEQMLSELAQEKDFDVPGYDADILDELYGIKSVQKSAEVQETPSQALAHEISEPAKDPYPDIPQSPEQKVEPPESIKQRREEAIAKYENNFVICPNCGERILLNA